MSADRGSDDPCSRHSSNGRSVGIECVGLTVLSDNTPAIGLYRSVGFEEEGRRRREVCYETDEYADQVQMALFLA